MFSCFPANAFQKGLANAFQNLLNNNTIAEAITYTAFGQDPVTVNAVVNQEETLQLVSDSDGKAAHLTANIFVYYCYVPNPSVRDSFIVRGITYKLYGLPEVQQSGILKLALKSVAPFEKSPTGYRINR